MIGVNHKHRYFRIQVLVSVTVSMLAYLAAKYGLLEASSITSSAKQIGISLFTIGPALAALVCVYFHRGALQLRPVFFTALILYAIVLVWPFVITSNNGNINSYIQQGSYFNALNFVGFLILGGITAWLGKLF